MRSLIEGVEIRERRVSEEFAGLIAAPVAGEGPEILVITCSDPRVDPGLARATRPGQIFPIRTAGNIVPPHGKGGGEEATVEFAVRVMGIRTVVVCGHTDCGAMKTMLRPDKLSALPSVQGWLRPAGVALRGLDGLGPDVEAEEKVRAVVEENVRVQLENLKTHSCIAEALDCGEMSLAGFVYDLESGEFSVCG